MLRQMLNTTLERSPRGDESCSEQQNQHNQFVLASKLFMLGSGERSELELGLAQSGDMNCCSRVSARGLTGFDGIHVIDLQADQFVGVEIPCVVATRTGRSPSMDPLSMSDDEHRISDINLLNLAPANEVFTNGIYDAYPFVEKNDFWFYENEKSSPAKSGAPQDCIDATFNTIFVKTSGAKAKTQNDDYKGESDIARGSIDIRVRHEISFSQNGEGFLR